MAAGRSGRAGDTPPAPAKRKVIETVLPNGVRSRFILSSTDGGQNWTATNGGTTYAPGKPTLETITDMVSGTFNVIDWIVENWKLALLALVCLLIITR